MMTLSELQSHMPEFELFMQLTAFLDRNNIPYKVPFWGEATIEDADAQKALQCYCMELEEKRNALEEDKRRKRATAQMLVTSGFNFDGYRIVKYSGYISGDDAMTVERGSAFTDGGVRDKLMSSLTQIRRNALRELKEAAYDLGCNAVIGVDFDYITLDPQTANITGGTTYQPYVFCVTANGNAVVIEKIEE